MAVLYQYIDRVPSGGYRYWITNFRGKELLANRLPVSSDRTESKFRYITPSIAMLPPIEVQLRLASFVAKYQMSNTFRDRVRTNLASIRTRSFHRFHRPLLNPVTAQPHEQRITINETSFIIRDYTDSISHRRAGAHTQGERDRYIWGAIRHCGTECRGEYHRHGVNVWCRYYESW